eukprot:scaffold45288_cov65-Cyclotella_meneghiniana.AAC.2
MSPILTSAAIFLAAAITSCSIVANAFTSSLLQSHRFHERCHIPQQLYGKKRRGSFLDEFPEEDQTKIKEPEPTQDDFHSDMITWLKQNPLTYINPKFKILPSKSGAGYGGFCSPTPEKIMKTNEMIMCIPRTCCVTFDDALNDEKCGGAFRMIEEYQLPDWQLLLVAGWTAKEYMMANISAEKHLKQGVTDDDEINACKAKIKHWQYLKTLPWKQGKLDQDHVLFWSNEKVDTLFKDSFAFDDAQLIRSRVQNATILLNDLAIGPMLREEMDLDESEPIDGLEEAITAAFVAALSRSFAEEVEVENPDGTTDIEVETLLIPLLDILQHSNDPNTLVETYEDYIILKARRTILPGEEIYHRYQEEDDKVIPPYKFFTRYGFVPGVTTPVHQLLEEKSPLFFDESWYSQFYS